jgi:hypothetical protein
LLTQNCRRIRSTMGPTACLAISRSTRPNLIPRISQFASRRDLGGVRWIITPTKASQPGTALTSAAIARSSSAVVIGIRVALGVCSIKRSPACRTGSKEGVCAETPTISHEPCVPTVIGVTVSALHLSSITRSAERLCAPVEVRKPASACSCEWEKLGIDARAEFLSGYCKTLRWFGRSTELGATVPPT